MKKKNGRKSAFASTGLLGRFVFRQVEFHRNAITRNRLSSHRYTPCTLRRLERSSTSCRAHDKHAILRFRNTSIFCRLVNKPSPKRNRGRKIRRGFHFCIIFFSPFHINKVKETVAAVGDHVYTYVLYTYHYTRAHTTLYRCNIVQRVKFFTTATSVLYINIIVYIFITYKCPVRV